jgi:tetratricopeptide (TPR) repeat protein
MQRLAIAIFILGAALAGNAWCADATPAAKILLLSGRDLPRAERYLLEYLTIEPEAGEPGWGGAHWRLGQVLEKEGKKNEAIAEMQEAVRLQPDFKPAKDDLNRLKK